MTTDQFRSEAATPSSVGAEQPPIEHPGHTDDMRPRPDHGEATYRGSGRLEGRRALITGGDSGIGRAVAIAFAREGADVAFSHLAEEVDDARDTSQWVVEAGRRAIPLLADLADEVACVQLVRRAVDELGGLDIVVNNAAYQMEVDGLEALSSAQLEHTFRVNVFALYWVTRAALAHLGPGSSIINTSSIQAFHPSAHLIDYAATKAAIVNVTRNLAQSLAARDIRVNSVAPGPIWTPLIPATMRRSRVESFGEDTPLGRPGQPAEVAPAFVFLASTDATFVTGETLAVTGGRLL